MMMMTTNDNDDDIFSLSFVCTDTETKISRKNIYLFSCSPTVNHHTHFFTKHHQQQQRLPLGRLPQVKTWYDESRLELVVTVLSAADLPPRVNGQYRNPYAKVYLLPDRR